MKVYCASLDCEYNHNKICIAKEIMLNEGHIHTKFQGVKHIHECKTYKESEYSRELKQALKDFNNALKGGAE